MRTHYDVVFITPKAAFYKVRLFNQIAKVQKILVLYSDMVNSGNTFRTADFFDVNQNFDNAIIGGNPLVQTINFIRKLSLIKFDRLCLSGWDTLSVFFLAFFNRKRKNSCIVESSIFESKTTGWKAVIKRLFLSRVSLAYVPGKSNEDLVRALGYKGECIRTGGCGLLNYLPQPEYKLRQKVKNFIYVGRLIDVKNVELLVSVFNELPYLHLSIAGSGPLESKLKTMAKSNITFLGQINNRELYKYYRDADVFILPSKSEPWGLVVEEALNNGTPVIVSDKVGCAIDLVTKDTGLIFRSGDGDDLKAKVLRMCDVAYYNALRKNISTLDFKARAKKQIQSFLTD